MNTREEGIQAIRHEFQESAPWLDERSLRLWCAARATAYTRQHDRGGVMIVHVATGVSRRRMYVGLQALEDAEEMPAPRVRRPGGGRKRLTETQPGVRDRLEQLVEPVIRGDPESPLRWVSKSTYHLRDALREQGYTISQPSVSHLLGELGYRLQTLRKTKEGGGSPGSRCAISG